MAFRTAVLALAVCAAIGFSGTGAASAPRTVRGTPGDDRLVGTAGRDVIDARGGDDVLLGRAGRDDLTGGQGDDRLVGGAGPDSLDGNQGDDVVRGGPGRDFLADYYGGDTLVAGRGRDRAVVGDLSRRPRSTELHLGRGRDEVVVQPDGVPDLIDCGPGRDVAEWVTSRDEHDEYVGCEVVREYLGP